MELATRGQAVVAHTFDPSAWISRKYEVIWLG